MQLRNSEQIQRIKLRHIALADVPFTIMEEEKTTPFRAPVLGQAKDHGAQPVLSFHIVIMTGEEVTCPISGGLGVAIDCALNMGQAMDKGEKRS